MRRARRTTRWRSCWASAIRAGRRSIGWRATGNDRACDFPVTRLTHADRNAPRRPRRRPAATSRGDRLQLQRPEDRGAAAGERAHGADRAASWRCRDGGARSRHRTSPTSAPAFSASWSTRCSIERSRRRAGSGARSVGIAGGVSANSRLRADAEARGDRCGMPVSSRRISLSTDNAAMIGAPAAPVQRGREA